MVKANLGWKPILGSILLSKMAWLTRFLVKAGKMSPTQLHALIFMCYWYLMYICTYDICIKGHFPK